jgi:hypothetical protein
MIYGPDDKPIPRTTTPLEVWCSKRALEILRDKFRFSDLWGSRIVDQYGRPIDLEKRPMVSGRTIQFYRKAGI